MKVVLFCGGQGMRMREYSESIPKPMVPIGYRPIMWHLMKYYAYYGHKDFIVCLGYKADVIKEYFLNYNECLSNDFVLTNGGEEVELLSHDLRDWTITFVDTGLHANIGQRLVAVKKYLEGEEVFMANYADGLADVPLSMYLKHFSRHDKVASFLSVKPTYTSHIISTDEEGLVESIHPIIDSRMWINGGFFIFKQDIFRYISGGEELVEQPFQRLISEQQLMTYKHEGFWACMDTFKEKQTLEEIYSRGEAPWEVWCDSETSPQSPKPCP
jgi:glucose-1-phosphate cytidylyltransferase